MERGITSSNPIAPEALAGKGRHFDVYDNNKMLFDIYDISDGRIYVVNINGIRFAIIKESGRSYDAALNLFNRVLVESTNLIDRGRHIKMLEKNLVK